MHDEIESCNIINQIIYSKKFNYFMFAISSIAAFILFYIIEKNVDLNFANVILSTFATSISIVAVSMVDHHRRIDITEKRLYKFYYPLNDYLQAYLIPGMLLDKKEVERIAHYRILAKPDTRREFEKYRNVNYEREKSVELSTLVRRDINEYEQKLKYLNS